MSANRIVIKSVLAVFIIVIVATIIYFKFFSIKTGDVTDEYNGINVYYNGMDYSKSHGKHYSSEGFYYGKKWQCVEFVKRYYHDYMHHHMPDGMGHAKDFYDKKLKSGGLNKRRNLIQYANGCDVKPAVNDILIFDGGYGHVCIISEVNENEIEVVQQNIFGKPRQKYELKSGNNNYIIGTTKKPLGWLHKR